MDELNKNIDESWKEAVEKEKEKENLKKDGGLIPPEPDFNFFVSTLALQASIALGQAPNPATNKTEVNPSQAKFIIDTLDMLKIKTKGNLTAPEVTLLDNVLYDLRMHYIAKTK